MTETTPRFGLPLLAAGQAQKELFHNEALLIADALMQPVAETLGDAAPPPAPQPGQSWIVGSAPTGAWAGQAGNLACWTAGGWRFVSPPAGMAVWVAAAGVCAQRDVAGWTLGVVPASSVAVNGIQVVGSQQAAVRDPMGGGIVDSAARDAIAGILAALRCHGLIAP